MGKEYVQLTQQMGNANQSPLGTYFIDNELASIYFLISNTNASASVGRSNFGAFEGLYATRILTGATTPLTNDTVLAQSYGFVGRGRYFIYQTKIDLPYSPATIVFEITHKFVINSRLWEFAIKYDGSNGTWYYKDSSASWVALPINFATPTIDNWFDFQLVIDLTNKEYVQVAYGRDFQSLSGISGYMGVVSTASKHDHTISVKTLAAAAAAVLVDNTSFQYSNVY